MRGKSLFELVPGKVAKRPRDRKAYRVADGLRKEPPSELSQRAFHKAIQEGDFAFIDAVVAYLKWFDEPKNDESYDPYFGELLKRAMPLLKRVDDNGDIPEGLFNNGDIDILREFYENMEHSPELLKRYAFRVPLDETGCWLIHTHGKLSKDGPPRIGELVEASLLKWDDGLSAKTIRDRCKSYALPLDTTPGPKKDSMSDTAIREKCRAIKLR